jgi:predicted PurR-regulated permease PerM
VKFGQWLGFFCLLISLYILWEIRELLLLVFTAIIFATALNRIVCYWQRFRLKRNQAIVLTLILTLIFIVLIFILIIPPFIEQFQNLVELLPEVWERIRFQIASFRQEQWQLDWLPPLPSVTELVKQLQPLGTAIFNNFFAFFSNSLTVLLQILLVVVLTLMMLVNPQEYRKAFISLFPSFYRHRADEILTATEEALGNWMGGIVLTSTFIGTLSGVGLSILGIKLVLVHALLAGLLNFIPNLGPTLSVAFPITISLLYEPPWKLGAIFILYFTIQNIESYWLTPTVMAKQVSLLPAVTLLAQIFFAQAFSLLGLLLALPLTVVAKTWLDELLFKDILDRWGVPNQNLILATSTKPIEKKLLSKSNDLETETENPSMDS